jgi:hypothetical protein
MAVTDFNPVIQHLVYSLHVCSKPQIVQEMGQEDLYTKHPTNFSIDTGYFALTVKC